MARPSDHQRPGGRRHDLLRAPSARHGAAGRSTPASLASRDRPSHHRGRGARPSPRHAGLCHRHGAGRRQPVPPAARWWLAQRRRARSRDQGAARRRTLRDDRPARPPFGAPAGPCAPLQPSPDGTRPMPDDAPTDVSLSGRDIGDFDQSSARRFRIPARMRRCRRDACERASEAVADLGRAVPASSGPTVEEGFRRALIAGRSAPAIRAQARQEGAPPSPAPAPFRRTVMGFGRKGL